MEPKTKWQWALIVKTLRFWHNISDRTYGGLCVEHKDDGWREAKQEPEPKIEPGKWPSEIRGAYDIFAMPLPPALRFDMRETL